MSKRFRAVSVAWGTLAVFALLVGCGGELPAAVPSATALPVPSATVAAATAVPATAPPAAAPTMAAAATTVTAMLALPTTSPTARQIATAAPSAITSTSPAAALAPDIPITEQGKWFNSKPLTLAGLRGKPVLLVFWSDI